MALRATDDPRELSPAMVETTCGKVEEENMKECSWPPHRLLKRASRSEIDQVAIEDNSKYH